MVSCCPKCFINGLNFTPIHLSTKGAFYFVGIQINVFALKYIFKIPAVEFNDQVFEAALVCKSLDEVAEKLYSAYSFNEQVDVIIKWLRGKIKSCPTPEANNRIVKLASDPDIIHLSKYHQIVCAHRFGYGTVPRPNRVRQEE